MSRCEQNEGVAGQWHMRPHYSTIQAWFFCNLSVQAKKRNQIIRNLKTTDHVLKKEYTKKEIPH